MASPALCRCYYSCNQYPLYYIDMPICRWDISNDDLIIETFLPSGDRNTLYNHLSPGASRKLYSILGTNVFKDTTYVSGNSLRFEPISEHGISSVAWSKTVAIKGIRDDFITPSYLGVKLECVMLD